jgi:hypothetical protein
MDGHYRNEFCRKPSPRGHKFNSIYASWRFHNSQPCLWYLVATCKHQPFAPKIGLDNWPLTLETLYDSVPYADVMACAVKRFVTIQEFGDMDVDEGKARFQQQGMCWSLPWRHVVLMTGDYCGCVLVVVTSFD